MTSKSGSPAYVVIGASGGLGLATARTLTRSHRVIVAGRDVAAMRSRVPGAEVRAVDLARLADVARFARELAASESIAGLVCNAGGQSFKAASFTPDGHEVTFAVNHLAHLAAIVQLAPAFAPGARVAFVGSGTLDPDDPGARRFGYRGGRYTSARELAAGAGDPDVSDVQRGRDRYATSKLCNLLAMRALARRVPAARIAFVAIDPGLMPGTGLARDMPWYMRLGWQALRLATPFIRNAGGPGHAGRSLARLVSDPALAGVTDAYFDRHGRARALPAIAADDRAAEELYATSLALCGLADPFARDAA